MTTREAVEREIADWIASTVTNGSVVVGIGIDVEDVREVDSSITRFFVNENDPKPNGSAEIIRLWTLKEAVFKATPGPDDTVLLDYVVDRGLATATDRKTGRAYRCRSWQLSTGIVSVAMVMDERSLEALP